ncbi:uncharacterized protein ACNLHF_002305 [Anomaloglossus baeobatrachus]|uniref:uncharacterized protein LOC142257017 n=1 Tax=Anomaloglossus baeobatrachus TaxID=238106 RepID=UPI003F4FF793
MANLKRVQYPKQETSKTQTHPYCFGNSFLSNEKTNQGPTQESNCVSMLDNRTSCKPQETDKHGLLHGGRAAKDHGSDHKPSMSDGQDNMDLYTGPPSQSSEVFADNSEENYTKGGKINAVDSTCPTENSTMGLHQVDNVLQVIGSDDLSSRPHMPLISKLEDGTTAQPVEVDCAPIADSNPDLSRSENNAKEVFMPNSHSEAIHRFSTTSDTDRNASTLNPDDDIYTDDCTTTAPNKQQTGGEMCEDRTVDSENKKSADHGEDINELLGLTPSTKEIDVEEKRNKVFDNTSPNDSSSTGRHLEGSNVTKSISPDNDSSMILESEYSSTVGNVKNNFVCEGQRSNISPTKLFEAEDIDEVCYETNHDMDYSQDSFSGDIDIGRSSTSIKNDDGRSIKASNISACSKLQGGGDVDTKESENRISINHGRSNNESLCIEPDNAKDATTSAWEENKVSLDVERSNNSTPELHESEDLDDVGSKTNHSRHYSRDSFSEDIDIGRSSSSIKNDDTSIKTSNISACSKLQGGGDVDTKESENKLSINHGRSNNESLCLEPNNAKDATTSAWEENKVSLDVQRSNNSTPELHESEDLDDVGSKTIHIRHYSRDSFSEDIDIGRSSSSIKNDDSSIKTSNISACSKLQGGDDVDTKESKHKMSLDHGRTNNESSCVDPNDKDATTATWEDSKVSLEVQSSNNSTPEIFGAGHNGNVDCRPCDYIKTLSTASSTDTNASNLKIGKRDASNMTTSNELETGANTSEEGRKVDFSNACIESEDNVVIDPEDKMSTDHGRSNTESSRLEPKIRETDVNKQESKISDVTSPNDSSFTQDVNRPVDHPTKSCNPIISQPEDSTTSHLASEGPRSKKHLKKAIGSKQNKKVNCRPNDGKKGKNWVTRASKADGNASIDVGSNQTTNISESKIGTSSDYLGKKRSNQNSKSNNLPINHNLEDKTSSGDGGENKVLSRIKLKSQRQSQTIEKNSVVMATTSSTCLKQHNNVSTTETRLGEKIWNVNRVFPNAFSFAVFLVIMALMHAVPVQAAPEPDWQQNWFCSKKSLMDQRLIIRNKEVRNSPTCSFNITALHFFHNCSELGYFVFASNKTCVEMVTDDLSTKDWGLEHGLGRNGNVLFATRGELLNRQSVLKRISEHIRAQNSSAPENQTEEEHETETKNETKDENQTKDGNPSKWIIPLASSVLPLLGITLLFYSLWRFSSKFRSWVNSCRRCSTNNDPESGPNLGPNTNRRAPPLPSAPRVKGDINGDMNAHDNSDENERLNPGSSEARRPQTSKTSL